MRRTFLDVSLSIDGFAAGPDIGPEHPLGRGGELLHSWLFGDGETAPSEVDRRAAAETFEGTGAFVMGRRTFDVGIDLWGDDGAFGRPCFVVTHRPRDRLAKGPTMFTFVTDGVRSALGQAKAAAGDSDVCIMGGADVARQCLDAGLVDELRLHLAPLILGAGTPLFADPHPPLTKLTATRVCPSPLATHIRYDLAPPRPDTMAGAR